jgi:hypothetical protein
VWNHLASQRRQLGRQAQVIRQCRLTRRNQLHTCRQKLAHGRIAYRFPVNRIGVGELAIGSQRGQVRGALGLVEWQAGVTEIAMQQRPQRIVVVHDPQGRQARVENIQAMSDQRRDNDCID